jgi:dUTP pyrophosphatase
MKSQEMSLLILKTKDNAVIPSKAGVDEVGWDLTVIEEHKVINDTTIMYDTGICVKPPAGYYTEIIPRSSIYKYGWMMANSIGVIDPTYRDTLKIVLVRVEPNAQRIELPCRIAQLVLRRQETNVSLQVVTELDETYRKGGFGSSG